MALTPTYHVYEMYTVHHDAKLLPVELKCADYAFGDEKLPTVNASASRDKAGKIHVTLCNMNPNQPATVSAALQGAKPKTITGRVLTAPAMQAHNTFEQSTNVQPVAFNDAKLTSDGFAVTLPAKSVVVVEIE